MLSPPAHPVLLPAELWLHKLLLVSNAKQEQGRDIDTVSTVVTDMHTGATMRKDLLLGW